MQQKARVHSASIPGMKHPKWSTLWRTMRFLQARAWLHVTGRL